MSKVIVLLDRDEERALQELALRQKRDPQQQAAYLIRRYLQMLRYLPRPETPARPGQDCPEGGSYAQA